jgi:hypothetical protein
LHFIHHWFNLHFYQSETVHAQWVMQLCKVGYKFSQIGGAFLIHYPHDFSKACQDWNKLSDELDELRETDGKKRSPNEALKEAAHIIDVENFYRAHIDKLILDFKKWLNENVDNESRTPRCENMDNDDHLLWVLQTNA